MPEYARRIQTISNHMFQVGRCCMNQAAEGLREEGVTECDVVMGTADAAARMLLSMSVRLGDLVLEQSNPDVTREEMKQWYIYVFRRAAREVGIEL